MVATNLFASLKWRTRRLNQEMRFLAKADPLSRKIYLPSMLRSWATRTTNRRVSRISEAERSALMGA